ncbi:MAG: dnaA [Burkholderiaceae bacterium]|nr:dnaA [Burkholderiaceae bacterium]
MLLFWQACSNQLQKELTPQQFKAWIVPLAACEFNEQTQVFTISAPSRIKAEACSRQFGQRIQMLAQEYWGKAIQIQFTVRDKNSKKNNSDASRVAPIIAVPVVNAVNHPAPSTEATNLNGANEKIIQKEAKLDTTYKNNHLDKNLNFDTLVTGNANQMARMVGLEVINQLGKRYNPFFIYGGVGVGKTHLMQAIGNEVYKLDPSKKIRYLFANTYVSEVVKAYQKNQFEEFKNYYHNLDLLLIDDIQFFGEGDKSGTQGAFFELFESLIRNKKQIIMTSDRYPQSLEGIQERLRSRFMSGIDIAIDPPGFEMRVSILLKKAELDGVTLPEEVAVFIAQLLRANVRELEGALRKVIAYSRFSHTPINIENTKLALKDLLVNNQEHISIEAIQKAVADFYKIKVSDMYSAKRPKNIAEPRQIAMYLTKELTQKSLPEIGANFGGRDHTTVLHACRKIAENKTKDSKLQHELHVLEQILKA